MKNCGISNFIVSRFMQKVDVQTLNIYKILIFMYSYFPERGIITLTFTNAVYKLFFFFFN